MGIDKDWHLEKTVSISHIVATVTAIVAIVTAWGNLNTRLSLLEQSITAYAAAEIKRDTEGKEFKIEIRAAVNRINDKLDRLIEGGRGPYRK